RAGTRDLRQRRQVADAGAGRPARGRAKEARQDVRVPPLRRRWPRLLLLRPPGLSRRAGDGRLGQGLRLLRKAPRGLAMCTNIATKTRVSGSAKTAAGWIPVSEALVGFDHATHAWLDHALRIDFVGSGDRAAVELDLDSARALRERLTEVIAAAEAS